MKTMEEFNADCDHIKRTLDAGMQAFAEVHRLKAINAELLAALISVMSWIDNWTPDFTYHSEWPQDRDAAHAAIAKAGSAA